MMRIELIKEKPRFAGTLQSSLTDSNRRPPPYHGTPSATGRNPRQPFSPAFAVSALPRFATDCHWLQPRGSIKAPSFVVCSGDASARRGDPRRSALGRLLTALDRPTTLCAATGRMRFSRIPPCSSPRPPGAGSSASSRSSPLSTRCRRPREDRPGGADRPRPAGWRRARAGRRRADQSGIGQGPFRPGCHFGNVAYASLGDVVSSSTPAPCRRASSERG